MWRAFVCSRLGLPANPARLEGGGLEWKAQSRSNQGFEFHTRAAAGWNEPNGRSRMGRRGEQVNDRFSLLTGTFDVRKCRVPDAFLTKYLFTPFAGGFREATSSLH